MAASELGHPSPNKRFRSSHQSLVLLPEATVQSNSFTFDLTPIKVQCECIKKDGTTNPYVDMARRFVKTTISILDMTDIEFIVLFYKYQKLYTFMTPPQGKYRSDNRYVLTISLKNNTLPPVIFPIIFHTRLDAYCRAYPNTEIDMNNLLIQTTEIFCPFCQFEYMRQIVPNSFKLNGRIQYTSNFMSLKEKRKPFLMKNDKLCWFVLKRKFEETNMAAIDVANRKAFEYLAQIRFFFQTRGYIGHSSVMTTGQVFCKLLSNFLCVVHGNTPSKYKYDKNYQRYMNSINVGNLDSVFGNIRFENVESCPHNTEQPIDSAYRIANNTQRKGFGFQKPRTSYQPVRSIAQPLFGLVKKVAYMSKEVECREIGDDDIGLIAIPDTTDGKNCGLSLQIVPGVIISNRLTCRPNIATLFIEKYVPDLTSSVNGILIDAYCEYHVIPHCSKEHVLKTIEQLVSENIHFDFNMDCDQMIGYIFSFHGTLIYDKCGMSAETKKWISTHFPHYFDNENLDILSFSCFDIPFIKNTNNSKIVGFSKSRMQEIDYPMDSEISYVYSHPHKTFMVYVQKSIHNEYDVGSIQNVLIAIMSINSQNVEEAILVNKSSVERGLFMTQEHKRVPFIFKKSNDINLCLYNLERRKKLVSDQLVFEIIGVDVCNQYSTNMSVKHRPNGFKIYYRDELQMKQWTLMDYELHVDEEGLNVYLILILSNVNYCCEGDKLTSTHAQKGIVSKFLPTEDLPFFQSGMIPDIFLNIGYYDRMTIGQDLEGIVGTRIAAGIVDDVAYNSESIFSLDVTNYKSELESIYDGVTGEYLGEAKILIIPYRRLRQEADQTLQSTIADYQNRRDISTGQFQKGKSNRGGASIGTMENVNVAASGSKAFAKKLSDLASGAFENPMNPHIGRVNRTAASINNLLMNNGYIYKLD